MKHAPFALAIAASLFLAGAGMAVAQSATFTLLNIEGLVIGKTMTVDAAYGQEHGVTIAAPFSFLAPTSDDLVLYVENAEAENATLIKVSFATKADELVENLQFVPMSIGMGETKDRLAKLATLLTKQAYPMAIATYPKNNFIGWRELEVAGLDAIEVMGEYIDPTWGHMYLRIVGLLHPSSEKGVFAVSNIVAAKTPITDAADFARTRSGAALGKFKFLE